MADDADTPVFHVEPQGGLACRMMQYMLARRFQSVVPGCRIGNLSIPEWGIAHPALPLRQPAEQHSGVDAELAERVRSGAVHCVIYTGNSQRLDNFPDVATCRALFPANAAPPHRLDAGDLACPLAGSDPGEDAGPFYPLTPAEYYAEIAAETGKRPVFIGPAPAPYLEHLRGQLPHAVFVDSGSTFGNLATARQAKSIVVSVSTFAWLAAFLSQAEQIFMPVSGAFNPVQYRFNDLLPLGDPRYQFHLFPINYAVPLENLAAAHRRLAMFWRPVPHDMLRRRITEAPRFDPPDEETLRWFDPAFYLAANPDIAQLIGADNVEGARAHYLLLGIKQHRLPFAMSQAWYAARYPMAAFEVAQGDYANFAHHYIAIGRERGYRLMPEPGENWWD